MKTGDDVQPDCMPPPSSPTLAFTYYLADNPEEVDGAPCAIQIITPRFQDEACLWIADIIDRVIQG